MDLTEAVGKLKHYHADYGDWVYTTTPDQARERASDYRLDAQTEEDIAKRLTLLVKAVQFEAVADCLEILGDNVPAPPKEVVSNIHSMAEFRSRRLERADGIYAGSEPFDETNIDHVETEEYRLSELKTPVVIPRFKIGDRAWIHCFDEHGEVEGYLPVIVVGLEQYPDEIWYMIGHFHETRGVVVTSYEGVEDCDIFDDVPDTLTPPKKPHRKPHLTVVK